VNPCPSPSASNLACESKPMVCSSVTNFTGIGSSCRPWGAKTSKFQHSVVTPTGDIETNHKRGYRYTTKDPSLSNLSRLLPYANVLMANHWHCRVWNGLQHRVRHVCTVTVCFPQSSEDSSPQTQFSLNVLLCPRSDTCNYGHINRCSYLLTYLLTYLLNYYRSEAWRVNTNQKNIELFRPSSARSPSPTILGKGIVSSDKGDLYHFVQRQNLFGFGVQFGGLWPLVGAENLRKRTPIN